MNIKEATNILYENTPADYVMEAYETTDFFEFKVSMGGDVGTYRVYKETGKVYSK